MKKWSNGAKRRLVEIQADREGHTGLHSHSGSGEEFADRRR